MSYIIVCVASLVAGAVFNKPILAVWNLVKAKFAKTTNETNE